MLTFLWLFLFFKLLGALVMPLGHLCCLNLDFYWLIDWSCLVLKQSIRFILWTVLLTVLTRLWCGVYITDVSDTLVQQTLYVLAGLILFILVVLVVTWCVLRGRGRRKMALLVTKQQILRSQSHEIDLKVTPIGDSTLQVNELMNLLAFSRSYWLVVYCTICHIKSVGNYALSSYPMTQYHLEHDWSVSKTNHWRRKEVVRCCKLLCVGRLICLLYCVCRVSMPGYLCLSTSDVNIDFFVNPDIEFWNPIHIRISFPGSGIICLPWRSY